MKLSDLDQTEAVLIFISMHDESKNGKWLKETVSMMFLNAMKEGVTEDVFGQM